MSIDRGNQIDFNGREQIEEQLQNFWSKKISAELKNKYFAEVDDKGADDPEKNKEKIRKLIRDKLFKKSYLTRDANFFLAKRRMKMEQKRPLEDTVREEEVMQNLREVTINTATPVIWGVKKERKMVKLKVNILFHLISDNVDPFLKQHVNTPELDTDSYLGDIEIEII